MSTPIAQVGRLAMRQEGQSWNAYYAMPGTMEGAIPLGSIRMGAVVSNAARKEAFMLMMRDIVADIIEENTGYRPTWGGPQTAPQHERAGNG